MTSNSSQRHSSIGPEGPIVLGGLDDTAVLQDGSNLQDTSRHDRGLLSTSQPPEPPETGLSIGESIHHIGSIYSVLTPAQHEKLHSIPVPQHPQHRPDRSSQLTSSTRESCSISDGGDNSRRRKRKILEVDADDEDSENGTAHNRTEKLYRSNLNHKITELCKSVLSLHVLKESARSEYAVGNREDLQNSTNPDCRYWAVFTIDATSTETAKNSFAKIGEIGGLGDTEKAGKFGLAQLEEPWLLIIYNADNPSLNLAHLVPEGDRGHVLITTTNPDFRSHGTAGNVKLKGLEKSEALHLLLRRADVPRPWDESTEAVGNEITKTLGYLALALIQAGTSIYQKVCHLTEYLSFHNYYRRQRQAALRSMSVTEEDDQVYTAFDLSMNYPRNKNTVESQDAHRPLLLKVSQSPLNTRPPHSQDVAVL